MPNRGEAGFTLLEAVVALTVVALVSIAALAALGAELRAAGRVKEAIPAAALAEHRLSVIRLLPRDDLGLLADSIAHGRFDPPFARYEWRSNVRPVSGDPNLFEAQIRLLWPNGEYTLRSRLYRPAPVHPLP